MFNTCPFDFEIFFLDMGFLGGSEVNNPPASAGDMGSIPELGISSGESTGNPLQYSYLKNTIDGEAWQTTAHGVIKCITWLSN